VKNEKYIAPLKKERGKYKKIPVLIICKIIHFSHLISDEKAFLLSLDLPAFFLIMKIKKREAEEKRKR